MSELTEKEYCHTFIPCLCHLGFILARHRADQLFMCICRFGDYYEWNKVTTCVHNILSGRRWIEHYGEITIRNTKSSACLCKLTFVKVKDTLRLQ